MITQILIDFLCSALAGLLSLIPPLPPEITGTFSTVTEGIEYVTGKMLPLGIVLPFDAIASLVAAWTIGIGVWTAALVAKLILTLAGVKW